MPRINTRTAHEFIRALLPFSSNGAISGDFEKSGEYVVKSYTTPIMIFDPETRKAFINCQRYSNTTSKHQGQVRRAIGEMPHLSAVEWLHEKEEFETATGYHIRQGRIS